MSHTTADEGRESRIKTIIYIDVLIALNLFVTYFLLLSTAGLMHQKPRRLRLLLGAVVGGLSSLLIFVDDIPFLAYFFVKVGIGLLLVLIAFSFQNIRLFCKASLFFLLVNTAYAGFMLALWYFVAPPNMYYNNGVAYFDISAITLCVSTILAYFFIWLVRYLLDRRTKTKDLYPVMLETEGRQVLTTAFYDSGNRLKEPFQGTPVMICEYGAVEELLPTPLREFFSDPAKLQPPELQLWKARIRIVPYQVVGGNGILKCFRPDSCTVLQNNKQKPLNLLVGVTNQPLSDGEYRALLPADCLNE